MAHVVLKLIGLASTDRPTPMDNQYVRYYNPSPTNLPAGECHLFTTPDIDNAKQYLSIQSAIKDYRRVDTRNPIRSDGHPNRPLTAFHVEFLHIDNEGLDSVLMGGVVSSE